MVAPACISPISTSSHAAIVSTFFIADHRFPIAELYRRLQSPLQRAKRVQEAPTREARARSSNTRSARKK
ncbi:MAG TPA: hypothetical protein VKD22_01730, partial [Ramlibacter sp.]|nr:hypothetical protein [Ramlibacter sp.]